MRDLTDAEKTKLESLIDACGLCDVLGAISEICDEKAEHIKASYQDVALAKTWRDAAASIGRTATFAATRSL